MDRFGSAPALGWYTDRKVGIGGKTEITLKMGKSDQSVLPA